MTTYIDLHSLAEGEEEAALYAELLFLKGSLVPSEDRTLLYALVEEGDTVICAPSGLPYWRKLNPRIALLTIEGVEDNPLLRSDSWLQWALELNGVRRGEAQKLALKPPTKKSKMYLTYHHALRIAEAHKVHIEEAATPTSFPKWRQIGEVREVESTPYKWKIYEDDKDRERVREVLRGELVGVDCETDVVGVRPNEMNDTLVGLAIATDKEAWYGEVSDGKWMSLLQETTSDGVQRIRWAGHHSKYDLGVCRRYGIKIGCPAGDGMLAAYLKGEREAGLKGLCLSHYGIRLRTYPEVLGTYDNISEVPIEEVAEYCCADAYWGRKVALDLEEEMTPEIRKIYKEIDLPLVDLLVDMEIEGVEFDRDQAEADLSLLRKRLISLKSTLSMVARDDGFTLPSKQVTCPACRNGKKKKVGCLSCRGEGRFMVEDSLNPGSGPQLEEWLHKVVRLPILALSRKTGKPSLDAKVLLRMRDFRSTLVLQWRRLIKYKGYLEDWIKRSEKDGRLHTIFTNALVVSGRLSSKEPNLMQVKLEWRRLMKAGLAADYAQLEIRIAAFLSRDPILLEVVNAPPNTPEGDLHAQTMMEIFGIPYDEQREYPGIRTQAKVYNFTGFYGGGAERVQGDIEKMALEQPELEIIIPTLEEVRKGQAKLQRKLSRYYKEFIPTSISRIRERGNITLTAFGRPRFLPDLSSRNEKEREAAEREAISHMVQGTAADLMRQAMLKVAQIPYGKQLLQVHDEIVCSIDKGREVWYAKKVEEAMLLGQPLQGVPLVVDVSLGGTWFDCHK